MFEILFKWQPVSALIKYSSCGFRKGRFQDALYAQPAVTLKYLPLAHNEYYGCVFGIALNMG